jgi:8-oxo-dGTP pyrophosphatase MutT (NUDIX family)
MTKLRDVTLVFLIKKSGGEITDICLAMKKRGFGVGRWNGVGGKVDKAGETILEAAVRETREEIGVDIEISKLNKIAELSFNFPHNEAWNQMVHVYFVEEWLGAPTESEEMNPKWFSVKEIPYSEMWPDDIYWLPQVLSGNLIKASFQFDEKDIILNKEINVVNEL